MELTPPDWIGGRIAVVGIGNDANGDDAAGVLVVRRLKERLAARPDLLLLNGGPAPENLTGVLRRFFPDTVVLVDAADLGEAAGAVAWVGVDDADGLSASTHTLPPSVLCKYLSHELGCRLALLGIQPARLGFGEPMSAEVGAAVDRVVDLLHLTLHPVPPALS